MKNILTQPGISSALKKQILTRIVTLSFLLLPTACTPVSSPNTDAQIATAILQILEKSAIPANRSIETPQPPNDIPAHATTISLPDCIPPNPIESANVTEITDGDTIHVSMYGQDYTVRYIGIDTPEMADGASAEAAKQANSDLVLNQDVIMVKDVNNTDRYDRLLRYVMVGDVFVNQQLVLDGLATAKKYPPDTACNAEFDSALVVAKTNQLGIWAAATVPLVEQKAATIAIGEISSTGNCDPSYPGVCIPPAPPDLDCKDVTFRRFKVIPPDPHHFDMDGDGIGCEGN
jgi:micrococcal nuclease